MDKEITRDKVKRVYSGTPGCCCGCRGKYTEVEGASQGAKGAVTTILNIMNMNLDAVVEEDNHLFLDMGHRWYIAYRY